MTGSIAAAFRIAIPARYASVRFPGKPLIQLGDCSMIEHVWRRACEAGAEEVVIATEDDRIAQVAREFGARVCMTAPEHASGTDRLAEVARQLGWDDTDIVVNLQGDEPLMPPALLRQVADDLAQHPDAAIATLSTPITAREDVQRPDIVKVVRDHAGYALYFSRAAIPHVRGDTDVDPSSVSANRHLGIYAYRAGFLHAYTRLLPAPVEQAEGLEQLRALWHGYRIHVAEAQTLPGPGVDTPADAERVTARLIDGR